MTAATLAKVTTSPKVGQEEMLLAASTLMLTAVKTLGVDTKMTITGSLVASEKSMMTRKLLDQGRHPAINPLMADGHLEELSRDLRALGQL
jgi:hypothetical protein